MKGARLKRMLLVIVLVVLTAPGRADEPAKLVEVRKIWDQAPHNAFTDLVRFKDRWFCVFREGKGHVSPDGALRVITSTDGEKWESARAHQVAELGPSRCQDHHHSRRPAHALRRRSAARQVEEDPSIARLVLEGRPDLERPARDRRRGQLALACDLAQGHGLRHRLRLRQGRVRSPLFQQGREEVRHARRRVFTTSAAPNESSIVFKDDTATCLLAATANRPPDWSASPEPHSPNGSGKTSA